MSGEMYGNRTHIDGITIRNVDLYTNNSTMVPPLGIEPSSSVLQTGAMTTSAKAAQLVRLERFELPTPEFVTRCSIQMSYSRQV